MNLVEKTLKSTNVYNGKIINVQKNIVQFLYMKIHDQMSIYFFQIAY